MVKHRWGVIYKLTNKNNGKYYFGKTVDYKNRMRVHKNSWKRLKTYLSNAIKKHGWDNFTKEIIVKNILCKYIITKPNGRKVYDETELNRLEEQHISLFQSDNSKYGYNLTKGGEGISGLIHSDETKKKMTMSTKKHDAEKGCIHYNKILKKWQVLSARPQEHIGLYNTKERATEALNLYNETGKILPSDLSRRKRGSGCISFNKRERKWGVKSAQRKHIGYYNTKEKATQALNIFNETGKRMESDKKKGSITLTKSNKYQLRYKGKHIGCYNTKELAQEALEKYLKKIINN